MKIKLIITVFIIMITGMAASVRCQPELVYVENGVAKKIDGVEKARPYYIEEGEKKIVPEKGEYFLRKNNSDFLSWGFATLNFVVKPDKEGALWAWVTLADVTDQRVWNGITEESLFGNWDAESIDHTGCILAWYEPDTDLVRVSKPVGYIYNKEKRYLGSLRVKIGSKEKKGLPVILFWKDGKLIPPKPVDNDDEKIISAIMSGHMNPLENIVKPDRLTKIEDRLGNRLIHYAAAFGDMGTLKSLINMGVYIDEKNDNHMTPLLLASAAGHEDIAALLLQHGAETWIGDTHNRTPLHYASYCGHEAVVKELINKIKKVSNEDEYGYTPVDYAISENHDPVVGLLASKKASLHSDQENQQLVLLGSISDDEYNTVSFLLDHKARADKEIYGTTPLVVAAGKSDLEMVELLVKSGAKIDKADNNKLTPLLSACLTGRPEVVKYLLDKGAKVNVKSKSGLSAIEAAVLRNDPEMIDLLISRGVDIETEDASGKTPFWLAAMLGHRKSMKKLLDAGARCNLDHKNAIDLVELAFRYDMPEAVELALSQCLNADFSFYDKYPSTWAAEYYSDDEILKLLLEHGAVKDEGENLGFAKVEELSEIPEVIEATPIYYPLDLKRKYGSRKFLVKVVVDDQGRVLFPKMIDSTVPELNRIVMATITKWRFAPPRKASGEACSIIVNIPVLLNCEEIEKSTWEPSEVDQLPRIIRAIPPIYPAKYRNAGIQGRVVLSIIIDENGTPEDVKIFSLTHKGFADAAVAAAKQYKFSPAYYHGKPVKIRVRLPIVFSQSR